ncbi:MAG TPA: bifunctional 5,10-methylenetetrahydrofolate dehydrogenase/5,10-methenyltetrahydrofolate cyclohydrolase [Candidatus Woesebacteria bacterium]|nr:bifunctional 5,10-methylenetetrahydrofolate dehydrogenase/5,10-methenyltetrahydrofolate cyclohydrolase [Candidatus Woesebacteria bacterium]
MVILDGKTVSREILTDLKDTIRKNKLRPVLDMILVGDNPASIKYTSLKQATGLSIGIGGTIHHLAENTSESAVIDLIKKLNHNPQVTAVMVQLPLPKGFNTEKIINTIDPTKDADGLTAVNLGRLFQKDKTVLVSATPLGIITLLDRYKVNLCGKYAVIINRSPFIGLALMALFLNRDATVSLCHSQTSNVRKLSRQADIIISGTGQSGYLTADYIRKGAVVIDVGMEVDFAKVKDKCSFITPPTGGVGPMTVASLLANTVKIALKSSHFDSPNNRL